MKKKAVIWIIAIVVLALVCGFLVYGLWGMKQKEKLNESISQAWSKANDDDQPAYLDALAQESTYMLEDFQRGNPWVLTVTVHGVDLGGALKKADLSAFTADSTEKDINDFLILLIKQAAPTKITTRIYAWPEEDGFRIEFSETFIDAMSGNVYSYAKEALLGFTGGDVE